jgi:hypothetical protein
MHSVCYFYPVLIRIEICQNNLVNIPNMKFHENLSGGSHVVPFGHVDIIRLVVTACFMNMPSSRWVRVLTWYRQRPMNQVHSTKTSPEIKCCHKL